MKILFAISLAGIFAAAALAYMTRNKLIEARNERDKNNHSINQTHVDVRKTNDDTRATNDKWVASQRSAKNLFIATTGLNDDIEKLKAQAVALNGEIKKFEDDEKAMQEKIDAVIQGVGKPADLAEKKKNLEGETDALAKDLANMKGEMDLAKKAADTSDLESTRRKSIQDAREKTISLTGRAATVLEVNPEFSFALLSVGRSNGLTTDSKLMVMRGGVHIANLKIVALEANRTIADIELKTARAGYQVAPGDRVVIETSVQ